MLPTSFPGRFGPFELGGLLGRGGMAQVYDGYRLGAHGVRTRVAVKCLLASEGTDPRLVQMFIEEARLNAQLRHPNLIAIHDFNEVDGIPYIAMEFVDGCDLGELITLLTERGETLPLHVVTEILRQLLIGLDYAHGALGADGDPLCLTHRDLKPANIFISHQGTVKIGDFGIAKTRFSSLKTSTGMLKGTPAYLSPEQFRGEPITPSVDFFALGLILYEMLVGQRFFQQSTLAALAGAMLIFRPRDLVARLKGDDAFDPFVPILERLLDPDPGARYSSAMDVLSDLGAVIARYPMVLPLRAWLAPYISDIKAERAIPSLSDLDLQTLLSQGNGPPPGATPGSLTPTDMDPLTGDTAALGVESMARLALDASGSGTTPPSKPSTPLTPSAVPLQKEDPPPPQGPQAARQAAPRSQGGVATPQAKRPWPALLMGGALIAAIGYIGVGAIRDVPSTAAPTAPVAAAPGDAAPIQAAPPPVEVAAIASTETPAPTAPPPAEATPTPSAAPVAAKPDPAAAPRPSRPAPVREAATATVQVVLGAIPSDTRVSIDGGAPQALPWRGPLKVGPHTVTFHCDAYTRDVPLRLNPDEEHRLVWNCPSDRPYRPQGR